MADLVECPHCNGSGKVPSSEALRKEADRLMREAYKGIERTRYGKDAREWAVRFEEKVDRVEEIRDELRRRVDHALGSI